MIWFTSDHHFGHENIIKYCDRPFSSVEEMDETMIERWNEKVAPDDTVYHLGDFSLDTWHLVHPIFHKLNGKIFALANTWHHDKRWLAAKGEPPGHICYSKSSRGVYTANPIIVLDFIKSEIGMEDDGYLHAIVLCHYPFREWERRHHGAWHLYGHTHQKDPWDFAQMDGIQRARAINVGVDAWDFYPVSLEAVKQTIVVGGG